MENAKYLELYNKTICIDCGDIEGGLKAPALLRYLEEKLIERPYLKGFSYVSPPNGFAQIALSKCCKELGVECKIYVPFTKNVGISDVSDYARSKFGAIIIYEEKCYTMKMVRTKVVKKTRSIYNLDCGFDDERYIELLAEEIAKLKLPREMTTLWSAVGSGTIVQAFSRVYPDVHYHMIQVGKTIYPDVLEKIKNKTVHIHPNKFYKYSNKKPPYDSVPTYDAKVWDYSKEMKSGDYVLNVAKQDF